MTGYAPLTLHVPEPAVRPGGAPDFSSVRVPTAGSVAQPEVNADPETVRDLAYSIIRVLKSRRSRRSVPGAVSWTTTNCSRACAT